MVFAQETMTGEIIVDNFGCTDGMKIVGVAIVGRPEVDLYPAQMKIRWEKEE
jgi:hypothetical protein